MLNGRGALCGVFSVLFVISVASMALAQSVDVLKAELKGVEGRLDAKIDGVKNELKASIDGAKDEFKASIDGVKNEVTIIRWIIGGIGAVFLLFLGFLAHLLNFYVKKVLPNMVQQENRGKEYVETGQPQEENSGRDDFADNTQPDYQPAGGKP